MNLFLKAKHWQLFLIIFALPLIAYIFMMGTFIINIENFSNTESYPEIFHKFMPFIIVGVISSLVLFCWKWSVAMGLQKYIPDENRVYMIHPLAKTCDHLLCPNQRVIDGFGDHPEFLKPSTQLHLTGMSRQDCLEWGSNDTEFRDGVLFEEQGGG